MSLLPVISHMPPASPPIKRIADTPDNTNDSGNQCIFDGRSSSSVNLETPYAIEK